MRLLAQFWLSLFNPRHETFQCKPPPHPHPHPSAFPGLRLLRLEFLSSFIEKTLPDGKKMVQLPCHGSSRRHRQDERRSKFEEVAHMTLFPACCYFPLSQAPSSFPVLTKLPEENQGCEGGLSVQTILLGAN